MYLWKNSRLTKEAPVSVNKISVLVIDDSALMRNLISRLIERDSSLEVIGTAMNGRFGLVKLPRLNPDVIVLDLEMPEMNGEALALGASDFITKPSGGESDELNHIGNQLVQLLTVYGNNYRRNKGNSTVESLAVLTNNGRVYEKASNAIRTENSYPQNQDWDKIKPLRKAGITEIIAIGISTGGPNALRKVFAQLDPNLKQPILVVQHMPAGFTKEFAASLNRICPLEVKEAEEGDIIKPGRILIAPGDAHIEIEKKSLASIIHLKDSDLVNGHKPSAGVLFNSIAKNYGHNSMAVIMTGMGKDGAREIGEIYREGGITIAQDQQSCIVYGMPRVAVEHNYIQHIVPLEDMAEALCTLLIE
ncbi:MAG: hypothetical protein B6241_10335 [Spirochaetaceae bacterium 4572_59]|nr:MAG: hypothetical protein B6241_10335 [Spirochaetaceae bacterium 4572_59]